MGLQANCLSILPEERVKVVINQQGDTLVEMCYKDAKILLEDVLHYEYADSLLTYYKERDSLNTEKITLQKSKIDALTQKTNNLDEMISNFDQIIANKDEEIRLREEEIKALKKEVRKQKFLKVVGFSAAVILPILTLLAIA
jgi:vacuolar-type H+-ATPase subunit I/STV1